MFNKSEMFTEEKCILLLCGDFFCDEMDQDQSNVWAVALVVVAGFVGVGFAELFRPNYTKHSKA